MNTDSTSVRAVHMGMVAEEAAWICAQAIMVPGRRDLLEREARELLRRLQLIVAELGTGSSIEFDAIANHLIVQFQPSPEALDSMSYELAFCGRDPHVDPGISYFEGVGPLCLSERLQEACFKSIKYREAPDLARLGAAIRRVLCPQEALSNLVIQLRSSAALPARGSLKSGRPSHPHHAQWGLRTWERGEHFISEAVVEGIRDSWARAQLGQVPDLPNAETPRARQNLCVSLVAEAKRRLVSGSSISQAVWTSIGPWAFSSSAARYSGTIFIEFRRFTKPLALLQALVELGPNADQPSLKQRLGVSAAELRQNKHRLIKRLREVPELMKFESFFEEQVFRLIPELLDSAPADSRRS